MRKRREGGEVVGGKGWGRCRLWICWGRVGGWGMRMMEGEDGQAWRGVSRAVRCGGGWLGRCIGSFEGFRPLVCNPSLETC